MHFHQNLQFLRKRNQWSQQEAAEKLGIPRTTLSEYERGNTEPDLELLMKMSKLYNVPSDDLILQALHEGDLDSFIYKGMKVLSISTDLGGKENIELVSSKAAAGYIESFQNPEFVRELPKISIPQLHQGRYRAFEINGESMFPLPSGSIVVCEYVQDLNSIKDYSCYVVISKQDGLVYKRVVKDAHKNQLMLSSDNKLYAPYSIDFDDVQEIWKYKAHISFEEPGPNNSDQLMTLIYNIDKKLDQIQKS
ncbi:MAG TPA: helix-turn-helix domain-containing protein [Saprospiraceae bacterium]|nr:helix-turn-helix domain-containing protein [Saprospiraceae bacterium]